MASKLAASPISKAGLSERELLMVAAAFSCLKHGDQTIDWDKFTPMAGYGSIGSARVCFRPLQKKLKTFVDSLCELGYDKADILANGPNDGNCPVPGRICKKQGPKTRGRPKKRKLEAVDEAISPVKKQPSSPCLFQADESEEPTTQDTGGKLSDLSTSVPLDMAGVQGPLDTPPRVKVENAASGKGVKMDRLDAFPGQSSDGTSAEADEALDTIPIANTGSASDDGGLHEYQGYYYTYGAGGELGYGEYVSECGS